MAAQTVTIHPRQSAKVFLAAFSLILFSSDMVLAHPHVWAAMRSTILLSTDGGVSGVRVHWTMDPAYAKDALDGLDSNGDGMYDEAELARLTAENLDALSSYDYFVFFRFNGEPQLNGKAKDGLQSYDPKTGELTLSFTIPLQADLDPRKGEIRLKIYDPEFFIDFEYVKHQPLLISRDMEQGCAANLMELPPDPMAAQTKSLLSTKDKDWKPENDEDFGSLFAQPVVIACAP